MKNAAYYKSKLTTLRSAIDELLRELEAEVPTSPRQRQNKRDARILKFDAMYGKDGRYAQGEKTE